MSELTHLDEHGTARMVDVGDKPATNRRAVARALVRMSPETAAKVVAGDAPKGDVLGTARIAGVLAAKRTGELIPLCHPLGLDHVDVSAEVDAAAVLVNASTRFTDGGEFGMGAEIGNSTQKLHARGPIGLRELCAFKYLVEGTGQVRA